MIISSHGIGHFDRGINNQDFRFETSRMLLVLDGCTEAKFSEVGTRLFTQIFSKKEECDKLEKFEDNVKEVFDYLVKIMEKFYPNEETLVQEYIMENLLFTIIACFEEEDQYVVKLFGDGYIITQNYSGAISYMKFSYGKFPPYYAYRYCNMNFDKVFKTFSFDKKIFPKIAIATDGIVPIVKGEIPGFDSLLFEGNNALIQASIKNLRQIFFDDVTIAMFGGKT